MRKVFFLIILLVSLVIFFAHYSVNISKRTQKNEMIKTEETTKEELSDYDKSGEGHYIITLNEPPFFGELDGNGGLVDLSLNLNIKNINVTPFITVVAADTCTLVDTKGNTYQHSYGGMWSFDRKPLLAGETASVIFKDGRGNSLRTLDVIGDGEVSCRNQKAIDDVEDWTKNVTKCVFNDKGECVCEDLGPFKLTNCVFRVSTDEGQADNGWGKFPLMVNMD